MSTPEPSLYERLGGAQSFAALTTALYQRVLADPELQPFFADTPINKLQAMQSEFLAAALGGPVTYTGRPLAHVHHGRGIQTHHFARFIQHFLDTLQDFGVADEDAYQVIARLNTLANEITGSSY